MMMNGYKRQTKTVYTVCFHPAAGMVDVYVWTLCDHSKCSSEILCLSACLVVQCSVAPTRGGALEQVLCGV